MNDVRDDKGCLWTVANLQFCKGTQDLTTQQDT